MRLAVISLPARADRRARFMAWNQRPGLEIAFKDGAVGADLDRAVLVAQNLLAGESEPFGAGSLGNALSHRQLWLEVRDAAAPAFICEDDACLRGDFAAQAMGLLSQSAPDWDIVFLGYNTNATVAVQTADGLKTILYFDESAKRAPDYFDAFAKLIAPAPSPLLCFQVWGTLCYALSPRGAARLLETCFPLSAAADVVMFGQNRTLKPFTIDGMINAALQRAPINAYCAYPPLAVSANDAADSDVVVR